jgi:hypothetical protein
MSAEETSGIGAAETGESVTPRKEEEARGIRQSAVLHTWTFTLGAMSTAVKQYNVGLHRSGGLPTRFHPKPPTAYFGFTAT